MGSHPYWQWSQWVVSLQLTLLALTQARAARWWFSISGRLRGRLTRGSRSPSLLSSSISRAKWGKCGPCLLLSWPCAGEGCSSYAVGARVTTVKPNILLLYNGMDRCILGLSLVSIYVLLSLSLSGLYISSLRPPSSSLRPLRSCVARDLGHHWWSGNLEVVVCCNN